MMLFLAGGRGFTRREGLRRIKERMENVPGFKDIRYKPSRLRPRTVVADVEIELFLADPFPRQEAKMEVLWRPQEGKDVQRVQWADKVVSLGWHKDDDHPNLGTTHFQRESDNKSHYEPGHIEVEAPVHFLEVCLNRLPGKLQKTT